MCRSNKAERMDDSARAIAKRAIVKLFNKRDELDYYDIICAIDIDLELVVELCAELEDEGVIGESTG